MDKRQQLIQTAFELFYQHGIHAVGINQILQTAGVAKKTLYNHFSSKDELIQAVVDYRDENFYNWLASRVEQVKPGYDGLNELFEAVDDWINNRVSLLMDFHGCFFINTCAEFNDPHHQIHQLCQQHKKRINGLIKRQIRALGISESAIDYVTESISLLKEGAIVMAQVQGDLKSAEKAKAMAWIVLAAYLS
jgi:AcrR family transcriptional regulator